MHCNFVFIHSFALFPPGPTHSYIGKHCTACLITSLVKILTISTNKPPSLKRKGL